MTKAQQQLAVLGALAIVMIAVYARAFRPSSPSARPNGRVEPVATQDVTERPVSEELRSAQRERLASLKWSRDPFTLGATSGGQLSGLILSGILWDATAPLAIINGSMVRAGEDVEGYRVVAITTDSVVFTDGTDTFQLKISP
jgi:hypothetical protein